jgi:DmsE family decaheme c-type cytochrome
VEERNRVCLSCHRAGQHLLWTGSAHDARDVPCTGCHKVMENVSPKHQLARPTELETCGTCHLKERALQMRSSHMPVREGKMTCTNCHSPHGAVTASLLKGNTVNETCYTCHAEKRGPYLWQHAPVVESCANCHNPHGSNHDKMLVMARPRPVPAVPHREPPPHHAVRQGARGLQVRARARLPELPREYPRLQPPFGLRVHPMRRVGMGGTSGDGDWRSEPSRWRRARSWRCRAPPPPRRPSRWGHALHARRRRGSRGPLLPGRAFRA